MKRPFAAVVLAAGRGTRMTGQKKLLAEIGGMPIVRRGVEAALSSRAARVIVVTGHDAASVRDALRGLDVVIVHNPDYAEGLSTSLRKGIASVPVEMAAALVVLGDMPFVTPQLIDALSATQEANPEALIVVPVRNGQRGKPVLWHSSLFAELQGIEGDKGARELLSRHERNLVELSVSDDAVLIDIDTSEELKQYTR